MHRGRLRGILRRDPVVDAPFQHVQRQRAVGQHGVVEGAHVEARAQRRLRPRQQRDDAQLADLLGERLGRPGDHAVHLDLVVGRRIGRIRV